MSGISWKEIKLKHRIVNRSDSDYKVRSNSALRALSPVRDPVSKENIFSGEKNDSKISYIESSIYDEDSIYDSEPNLEKKEQQSKDESESQININYFMVPNSVTELSKQVQETNKQLDKYIDDLIKKDDIEEIFEKSRSESIVSFVTIDNSCNDTISNNSIEESLTSYQLVDIDYHYVCVNSLTLKNIPIPWYDSESESIKKTFEINTKWRDDILNELIKRNLKEFRTVDKISVPYANDASWSLTDSVQMLYRNKLVSCLLEIIHCNNSIKKLLVISIKQKLKLVWKKEIDFSQILLIKPYLIESKRSALSFAIYLNDKQFSRFVFVASSKNQLSNWLCQVSIYCSKIHFLNTLSNALSLVTNDGYSYFLFLNDTYGPSFLNQIDGHFKQIEKHSTGTTFACGENGKFWILDVQQNKPLDSYKGKNNQRLKN